MSELSAAPRWSGFGSQSLAWQRGYDWAYDRGPHAELGSIEASEAWGYDFLDTNDEQFTAGAKFAQLEQRGG